MLWRAGERSDDHLDAEDDRGESEGDGEGEDGDPWGLVCAWVVVTVVVVVMVMMVSHEVCSFLAKCASARGAWLRAGESGRDDAQSASESKDAIGRGDDAPQGVGYFL